MLETKTVSSEDRLWLLADIADEVSRLKPGTDDKIRVACHAADALRGHQTHMTSLLDHIPETEYGVMAGKLSRKTVYPHVAARSYVPAGMTEVHLARRAYVKSPVLAGHMPDSKL